jgi:CHAD domain-containing protein
MAYRLGIDESVELAVRRIAHEQIRGALRDAGEDSGGRNAKGVHEARKRCKKLRSLLRLVEPAMGDAFAIEDKAIRDAARRLSPIRDAHVMLGAIESLRHEVRSDAGAEATLARRGDALRADESAMSEAGAIDQFLSDMRSLDERVDQWSIQAVEFDAIAPGLKRTYRRARRSLRRALALPSPENLHEWRKHAKHHQYHVRLLLNLWPRVMQARYDETKVLTDALGEDHDLALLRRAMTNDATASSHARDEGESAALLAVDRRRADRQADAFELGRRLFSEKPRAFERRVGALWALWRSLHRPGLNESNVADDPVPEVHTRTTKAAPASSEPPPGAARA